MKNITGTYFLLDQKLFKVENEPSLFPSIRNSIYEVIRVIGGTPLFVEEHTDRLNHSLDLKGFNITFSVDEITGFLNTLIRKNQIDNGNIRLDVVPAGENFQTVLYQVPAFYPGKKEYENGVQLISYHAERKNPEIKQTNLQLRQQINTLLEKTGAYEVLLITDSGLVTEGSRSNIFFIKENKLFSAPESGILEGITAKYIKKICRQKQIEVEYNELSFKAIDSFESCFITGTSPKVLPVKSIDDVKFKVNHPLLKTIMQLYQDELDAYSERKNQKLKRRVR